MSAERQHAGLVHALALSQQMILAADNADLAALTNLDGERTKLIHSFRRETRIVSDANRTLLRQITELNDRAIGLLEHQQRRKAREMDMAAVGRRAVAAYAKVGAR